MAGVSVGPSVGRPDGDGLALTVTGEEENLRRMQSKAGATPAWS